MIRARWKYGLALIGLALLHEDNQAKKTRAQSDDSNLEEDNVEWIETQVEKFTRAIAPVPPARPFSSCSFHTSLYVWRPLADRLASFRRCRTYRCSPVSFSLVLPSSLG